MIALPHNQTLCESLTYEAHHAWKESPAQYTVLLSVETAAEDKP